MTDEGSGEETEVTSLISTWHIDVGDAPFFEERTGQRLTVLDGLSKINLFVAPNNSGKSKFLRLLSSTMNPRVCYGGEVELKDQVAEASRKIGKQFGTRTQIGSVKTQGRRLRQPGAVPRPPRGLRTSKKM